MYICIYEYMRVALCCSVLQCVVVCYIPPSDSKAPFFRSSRMATSSNPSPACAMLQCVAVCCSVLQCVAVSL